MRSPVGARQPIAIKRVIVAAICAVASALDPRRVVAVPAERVSESAFPRLARAPAELALELARIDGVAAVVAGAVADELDQRIGLVEPAQDRLDHFEIAPLVAGADVINLTGPAAVEDRQDGPAVVVH